MSEITGALIAQQMWIAASYLPCLMALIVGVMIFPALAFFPRLIFHPRTAAAIPVIGLGISTAGAYLLLKVGLFSHDAVLFLSLLFALTAVTRFIYSIRAQKIVFDWQAHDKDLFYIALALCLPMIAIAGLSSFMFDDALASWNHWAVRYYFGLSNAGITNGYPQFFPLAIANAYQFLGSSFYQGPVKALFCLLPFSMILTLFLASPNRPRIFWPLILIFFAVFPDQFSRSYLFYTRGYADPLLATALFISASFLLEYFNSQNNLVLIYAVICAIIASLSKQPGFMWALWGFPVLMIAHAIKSRRFFNNAEIWSIIVVMVPVMFWLLGDGRYFMHNQGVLQASTGHAHPDMQNLAHTFWQSVVRYWLETPGLLLLFLLAGFLSFRQYYHKIFFWLFIIPGVILWFTFGAYEIRLGLHLCVLCALLIALSSEIKFKYIPAVVNIKSAFVSRLFLIFGILLFIVFSFRQQNIHYDDIAIKISPLDGPRMSLKYYFDDAAPYVYQHIFNQPQVRLWVLSTYLWGFFDGYNKIMQPVPVVNKKDLYAQLLKTAPDYIITGGKLMPPALRETSDILRGIIQSCPGEFTKITPSINIYHVELYQFHGATAAVAPCDVE